MEAFQQLMMKQKKIDKIYHLIKAPTKIYCFISKIQYLTKKIMPHQVSNTKHYSAAQTIQIIFIYLIP